jgi:hypothetical protein
LIVEENNSRKGFKEKYRKSPLQTVQIKCHVPSIVIAKDMSGNKRNYCKEKSSTQNAAIGKKDRVKGITWKKVKHQIGNPARLPE